jgi:hypothetical protein
MTTPEQVAYEKHRHLKRAADELGIPWSSLYSRLRSQGVPVAGDKLHYGSDRDRLSALAEAQFKKLVPDAVHKNATEWQARYDFDVRGHKVDVKASMRRQLNKKYQALSWAFAFKKQSMVCDFICCFCMNDAREIEKVLLVPREFFAGLQTVSVSCHGDSKWLDYAIDPDDLSEFFRSLPAGGGA